MNKTQTKILTTILRNETTMKEDFDGRSVRPLVENKLVKVSAKGVLKLTAKGKKTVAA